MRKLISTLLGASALALAALAISSAAAPAPAKASEPCYWDFEGFHVHQSNGYTIEIFYDDVWTGRPNAPTGRIEWRSATPALLKFIVHWSNGSVGVYTGSLDWSGWHGTTYDAAHPASTATWTAGC